MLLLKPLSEDRGRSLVQISQELLSLRIQAFNPHTCTYVRLLGPCFKTGRKEPFRQHLSAQGTHLARTTYRSQRTVSRYAMRGTARDTWYARLRQRKGNLMTLQPPMSSFPGTRALPRTRTDVGSHRKIHHAYSARSKSRCLRYHKKP